MAKYTTEETIEPDTAHNQVHSFWNAHWKAVQQRNVLSEGLYGPMPCKMYTQSPTIGQSK